MFFTYINYDPGSRSLLFITTILKRLYNKSLFYDTFMIAIPRKLITNLKFKNNPIHIDHEEAIIISTINLSR